VVYDTTIGWRFVNPAMKAASASIRCPKPPRNVASDFGIAREDQDKMALASQRKAVAAQQRGFFDAEITPVTIATEEGRADRRRKDEHTA
jgi:acetyl-CoA acetyltransferase